MEIFLFLGLVGLIIVLSGLVSGSEAALLSVSFAKTKELANSMEGKAKKQAEKLLKIKENLQQNITTIVVLNNVINIVGSIYVGVLASEIFGEIYLGLVSGVLTFLIIMFSEIIPKVYGERYCESISLHVVTPLTFFTKALSPIVFLLNSITNFFVKDSVKNQISQGEIREMAAIGMQEGSINSYENDVIENVFKMNDTSSYDIMVPKNKTIVLSRFAKFDEIVKKVEETGFTRFPIEFDGEIIGLINAKDLFKFYEKPESFRISKVLRPIIFAPESMKLFVLEEKLKLNRTHMAAIVNEHGDFTGIVTLEDIIEELLGNIEDEFDASGDDLIRKVSDKKFIVAASIEVSEFNSRFDESISEDEDFSTLNGFLTEKLGKIPNINDMVGIESGKIRVIKRTKKKVTQVEFCLKQNFVEEKVYEQGEIISN